MRILIAACSGDFVDKILDLLHDGHEVFFAYVEGMPTPFSYEIDFADCEEVTVGDLVGEFSNEYNQYWTLAKQYAQKKYPSRS